MVFLSTRWACDINFMNIRRVWQHIVCETLHSVTVTSIHFFFKISLMSYFSIVRFNVSYSKKKYSTLINFTKNPLNCKPSRLETNNWLQFRHKKLVWASVLHFDTIIGMKHHNGFLLHIPSFIYNKRLEQTIISISFEACWISYIYSEIICVTPPIYARTLVYTSKIV